MIRDVLKQLFPYIRPYKKKGLAVIGLSFVLAAIGAYQVSLVKPLIDKGLSAQSNTQEVIELALILLGLGLLNFPTRFFHFYWLRFIVDQATCRVREQIFSKLITVPTNFFNRSKEGELISHIINDSQIFSQGFKSVIDLVREPLKAIAYLSMAFYADWQLTLVIFLIAPFLILIFSISGKKVKNNQSFVQSMLATFTHNISEGISSHRLTKAFNLQRFISKRFSNSQESFFQAQMKTTFVEEMAHPFVEVVGACAFSGVIVFAHYRIQSEMMTMGDFISFIAALALFMDPIRKFSQANVKLSQAKAAGDRIQELLSLESEKDLGPYEKLKFRDKVEVNDLTFSYGEGDVLKNLSLSVEKGSKVALVGLSGSGKSTLINLLLGLYPVESDQILIDGVSIDQMELKSLRGLFALVSQDIFLFNDTIRENLCLGRNFSEDQIKHALEIAYAENFIKELPQGIDTVIGDRGTRLSGGQKQRITIARAYLQDCPILLFDEATSALDNESERLVQKALENLSGHKTVIAVAHRLSTIQDFDKIYVLSSGRVVESGTHEELLNQAGEYAKLYELSVKS